MSDIENFKQEERDKAFSGKETSLSFNTSEDIKLKWECQNCQTILKICGYEAPETCNCGKPKWKNMGWEYSEARLKEAGEMFRSPNLIKKIHEEITKKHMGDDSLKMTVFLVTTSGLLKDHTKRMSIAITGDSSVGKDNLIKTILKHQPEETQVFVTNATQATMEDDLHGKKQIAFSEVNAGRENGSNKHLVEIIKQKSEGGTSSIKKDLRTGMQTSRHEKGEQASILFGTTEAFMDDEMKTRFIKGTITTDYQKIKKVNENTLDSFSDLDKTLNNSKERDSWIRVGLTYFSTKKEQPIIYLPYAKFLKEQINGKDIFDYSNPRSQRDIKRVLSLTCAMTYLFQEQREKMKKGNQEVLISEPQDFLNVVKIAGEFFNQSYRGIDQRANNVIKIMQEIGSEWVARDEIQNRLGVSKNTIKSYCSALAEEGLIQGNKGKELNFLCDISSFDGNRIYYKRCQKEVKKPLIRCQINELREFLERKIEKTIDTFDFEDLSSINEENNILKDIKKEDINSTEIPEESAGFF